ncbi:MAG: hypothetical protein WD096_11815 [Actinomycetota bacterium]
MWWVALALAIVSAAIGGWRAWHRDRRQRALLAAAWRSGLRFSVFDPFPDTVWLPFALFGPAQDPHAMNVVWDRRDDGIRAFDLGVTRLHAERDGIGDRRWMSCAAVPLPFSCPRLTIASRTATDPAGITAPGGEVVLELETFNRRFRVQAEEPRAAVAFCDQRMMRALMALPLDVTIHVNEHVMLLVAPMLEPGQVLVLLEAARGLSRVVPPVVASLYPPRPATGPHEARWLQGHWSADPTTDVPAGPQA